MADRGNIASVLKHVDARFKTGWQMLAIKGQYYVNISALDFLSPR
jgi:hypothetical protein